MASKGGGDGGVVPCRYVQYVYICLHTLRDLARMCLQVCVSTFVYFNVCRGWHMQQQQQH